jgi:hypothetical protein
MPKYIKDKNGKFAGSIPEQPKLGSPAANDLPTPPAATPTSAPKEQGIEWVVSLTQEDGTVIRGIQKAWYGHPAIDFFAKKHGVKYKTASSEKKMHFDRFLAEGLRKPLEEESAPTVSEESTSGKTEEVTAETQPAPNNICEYKGCDGEAVDTVNWSAPVNRAGKVSPSGENAQTIKVCKGHWWALTTAMYGSD